MLGKVFLFVTVVTMGLSFGQLNQNKNSLNREAIIIQNNDSIALLSGSFQEKSTSETKMKKTIIISGFIVLVVIGGVLSLYYAH